MNQIFIEAGDKDTEKSMSPEIRSRIGSKELSHRAINF